MRNDKKWTGINYWLKARLLAAIPPGQYAAFWLGGRATVIFVIILKIKHYDEHHYHNDDEYEDRVGTASTSLESGSGIT